MEILNEKIRRTQLEINRIQNQMNTLEAERRQHEDHMTLLEREKKERIDYLKS